MYVIVQYGEKEEKVFNSNCKCIHLLRCLRNNGLLPEVDLDLSDEEGNVKLLRNNLDRYANEFLSARERLVLLRVSRSENGDCIYTPLLKNETVINGNYLARLATRTTSAQSSILKSQLSVNGNSSAWRSAKGARQLSPEVSPVRASKTPSFNGVTNQPSQKMMKLSSSGHMSRQRSKSKQ